MFALTSGEAQSVKPTMSPDGYLSDNFIFTLQSFLVVLEYLNEVIHTTEETQPNGCDNHQEQIDIT